MAASAAHEESQLQHRRLRRRLTFRALEQAARERAARVVAVGEALGRRLRFDVGGIGLEVVIVEVVGPGRLTVERGARRGERGSGGVGRGVGGHGTQSACAAEVR